MTLSIEAKKAQNRAYYLAHIDVLRAKAKERSVAYYRAHSYQINAATRAYRKAHPEKMRSRDKALRLAHHEERKAGSRASYFAHRKERKASVKAYQYAHPEKVREWAKTWRRTHLEKGCVYTARYLARKRNLPDTLTVFEWQAILAAYKFRCAYCGRKAKLTQDHVVPLSKGGGTTANNIVPACGSCNSSKQANYPSGPVRLVLTM